MESKLERPLGFGEVLDVTFRIVKEHFGRLFLIMLILIGPLYLLQGLAMLLGGTPFFSTIAAEGGPWTDSFLTAMEQTEFEQMISRMDIGALMLYVLALFVMVFVLPVAWASVILSVDRVRKGEDVRIGAMIQQATNRYFPLLGGSLVYFLIFAGFLFVFSIVAMVLTTGAIFAGVENSWGSVVAMLILIPILGLASFFVFVYFMIRWSFYFAGIVFERISPGLTKSWHLTRYRFWRLFGLYIVLSIITSIVSVVFQTVTLMILGNSVLSTLLFNLMTLLLMMITFVAYAVMYFDLRIRNEGVDVKEMVDSYRDRPEET